MASYRQGRKLFTIFVAHFAVRGGGVCPMAALRGAKQVVHTADILRSLLATPTTLPLFIAFARGRGLRYSTIRAYIHGVRFFAASPLHPAPPVPVGAIKMLYGCERLDAAARLTGRVVQPTFAELAHTADTDVGMPDTPAQRRLERLPLTGPLLSRCLACLQLRTDATRASATIFHARLLAAAMAMGFYGCLRVSEYMAYRDVSTKALRICDVEWVGAPTGLAPTALSQWVSEQQPERLVLSIFNAKTARPGEAQRVCFTRLPHTDAADCPVRLGADYLAARVELGGCLATSPLFVLPSGQPPKLSWYNTAIKRLVQDCGEPESGRFSSHSLRIGAATTAVMKGAAADEVKALGRWRSAAFEVYVSEAARQVAAAKARGRLAAALPTRAE